MPLSPPSEASTAPNQILTSAFWANNVNNAITFLANPPLVLAYAQNTQSISSLTPTAVLFDSEVVDTYGMHSTTSNTSRVTAVVAGWYAVSGIVAFAPNGTGTRKAILYVNGTALTYANCESGPNPTSGFATQIGVPAVPVFLNVGDYVEVWANQGSGGALNLNPTTANQSSLTVHWMHV